MKIYKFASHFLPIQIEGKEGNLYYDIDLEKFYVYKDKVWLEIVENNQVFVDADGYLK